MPDGRQANPPEPSALLGQKHPINQIESGRFYAPGRGDDNPIVSRGAASSMQSGSSQPSLQEQALLNHVKRLERAGGSHCAVQVHQPKLIDFQHLPERFDVVSIMMAREAKTDKARLYV